MTEQERTKEQLEEALDIIDDMMKEIGGLIITIAHSNDDFICTECLRTAQTLFGLMKDYASEEDVADIREQWNYITDRSLED